MRLSLGREDAPYLIATGRRADEPNWDPIFSAARIYSWKLRNIVRRNECARTKAISLLIRYGAGRWPDKHLIPE